MEHSPLRFLVVKAHPHDFTHVAGTLGVHTSMGDEVTLVVVSSGVYTHNEQLDNELSKPPEEQDSTIINQTPETYAAVKAEELRKAASLFGVTDVRILNQPEPFRMDRSPEAVNLLWEIIMDVRPHVLITQSPYHHRGPHGMASGASDDHSETAYAVLEARTQAAVPGWDGTRKRPHHIAATYYAGVYFQRDQFDFVVDVTDWHEQRVQAELMYRSQGHTDAFARRRIEINLGNTGWFVGVKYGEAFVREQTELVPRITVSEYALRRAKEPQKTHIQRISGELDEGSAIH